MDKVLEGFLKRQLEDAATIAQESDLVAILPMNGVPPDRYLARFRCKGLVAAGPGEIAVSDSFGVGIWFPSDYLRRADPYEVITWLHPRNVFHPNISARYPVICIGRLAPATPLTQIVSRCFDVITYNKVTMREDDALNKEACAWARKHQRRFPIDTRPLKRRGLELHIEERCRELPCESRGR